MGSLAGASSRAEAATKVEGCAVPILLSGIAGTADVTTEVLLGCQVCAFRVVQVLQTGFHTSLVKLE